jgi:CDP-glucose 4,6-dehydratase
VPTFETNIRGTWLVLEACRGHGTERVVVASSDKAYGRQPELPYREEHPLDPRYPYDVSKAAADMLARSYSQTFGLPVAVTRLANVYGGGDTNRARLIPEAVCAALAGEAPVVRSDGSPERDFLYVEDAARAYLAVWQVLAAGAAARGEAFNAGGGEPRRVLDVIEQICRRIGGARHPRRGRPPWRDRPPMARLDQAPRAHRMASRGPARGGPAPDHRLVPGAPGRTDAVGALTGTPD